MGPALQYLSAIIEHSQPSEYEMSLALNSTPEHQRQLQESYLIEALNLKAAIEFQLKNTDAAKQTLSTMPPKDESDLDPVTSSLPHLVA